MVTGRPLWSFLLPHQLPDEEQQHQHDNEYRDVDFDWHDTYEPGGGLVDEFE
ncbi:MAG: hypothetical protein HYT13_01230 [Candidatus Liptonbacteria bacterium]|nr:hypothetical protein [Candidatus Liptonbacteria bacterium]